jgi:hypothetical protein
LHSFPFIRIHDIKDKGTSKYDCLASGLNKEQQKQLEVAQIKFLQILLGTANADHQLNKHAK